MKDGQAVFTNLEKLYFTYRYTFTKGKTAKDLIDLDEKKINARSNLSFDLLFSYFPEV